MNFLEVIPVENQKYVKVITIISKESLDMSVITLHASFHFHYI